MSTRRAQQPSQPTDPGGDVCLSLRPASFLPPLFAGTGSQQILCPGKAQPLIAPKTRLLEPVPFTQQVLADL